MKVLKAIYKNIFFHEEGHAVDPKINEYGKSLKQSREREAFGDVYNILRGWRSVAERVENGLERKDGKKSLKFGKKRGKIVGKRFAKKGLNYRLETRSDSYYNATHWSVLYLRNLEDIFESLEEKVLYENTDLVALAEKIVQDANVKDSDCTIEKRKKIKYEEALKRLKTDCELKEKISLGKVV